MVDAFHAAGNPGDGGLWHCDVGQWHLCWLRHGRLYREMVQICISQTMQKMLDVLTKYTNITVCVWAYADRSLAGCADGSGGNGGAGTAVEGGKTLFTVFTLPASALFTALQLEPELSNLKVTERKINYKDRGDNKVILSSTRLVNKKKYIYKIKEWVGKRGTESAENLKLGLGRSCAKCQSAANKAMA